MAQAIIARAGYRIEYLTFIPRANDWRVEGNGIHRTFDEADNEINSTPFSVRLTSDTDSAETLAAYLATHATLAVNAAQNAIVADGVSNTLISVSNGLPFSYRIMRYNIEVAVGEATDGTLDFATTSPAEYLFELIQDGNTGYTEVIAS